MSINSLTEVELRKIVKRRDASLNAVANAAGGGGGGDGENDNAPPNNALSMLVKYIPTESVTLYVAAISAAAALKVTWPRITEISIYWFFVVLTPILFAVVFLGKLRTKGLLSRTALQRWPWWKTFASTVAFVVWGLAVPGLPDIPGDTSGAIAGLFALFISTFLSLLEPLFDRPPDA